MATEISYKECIDFDGRDLIGEALCDKIVDGCYGRYLSLIHGEPLTVRRPERLPIDCQQVKANAERWLRLSREEWVLAAQLRTARVVGLVERELGPSFMDAWNDEEGGNGD